jgi:glycosyltransferase involved in cell wall biosynthesis
MHTIVHFSTLHARKDTRVFLKEVRTLASCHERVIYVVQDGGPDETDEKSTAAIVSSGQRLPNKYVRLTVGHWRMLRTVLRQKPDIVHFHDIELIPIALVMGFMGIQVIYDVHEDYAKQFLGNRKLKSKVLKRAMSRMLGMVERLSAPFFSAIVCATPYIGSNMRNRNKVVVRNFPIADELAIREDPAFLPPKDDGIKRFAFVGGLTAIRGIKELVQAFHLLGREDVRLMLGGVFNSAADRKACEVLPGWPKIEELGGLDREGVARCYQRAVAGIVTFLPLPNHVEALPNKLFEYMSAGLPVIASDFPVWRDIVERARCGLLVDPARPQAIAEAIAWVLDHPAEASAMGRNGRQAVQGEYNWSQESVVLTKLYEKLLAGG